MTIPMKLKLTTSERDALLPHIKQVIETGKDWKDDQLHHPAGAIIAAISEISGMKKLEREGFNTNGWQWDWWQRFAFKGKKYTLSGSGYYGGHSFNLSDE